MNHIFICICIFILHSKVWSNTINEDEVLKIVKISPQVQFYSGENGVDDNGNIPMSRHARSSRYCRYPTVSEDSDIFCKIYPSRVECNQTCIFGHTFKESRTRMMRCNYEEDEWKPFRRFEECRPYVDCTLALGPGGKMACRTHFMNHGPICDVSCKHYEDKPAVPSKTYECDFKGRWHPKLPFCASPGSGLDLVPPPKSIEYK